MKAKVTLLNEFRLLLATIFLGVTGLTAYAASKFTPGKLIILITGFGILGFVFALILLDIRLRNFSRIAAATGLASVSVIAGTYILLFAFVYLFQDAVADQTSFFFQPKSINSEAAQALVSSNISALELTTPDGSHLRGWLVHNSTEAKAPLVIYFGGSGSESSEMIPFAKSLVGWSVALINYRGFGLSEGTPTHENVLADSVFVYDTLASRSDIDSKRIIIMGYSLGTGVAVSLSSQRPVVGTVLVAPYDTWSLIGVKRTALYAPLSGIMKHYFDSVSLAPGISSPLLCLVGMNDTFIPPNLSRSLVDDWGGEAEIIEYPEEDHGLLFHHNSSWTDIAEFLRTIKHD